MFARSQVVFGAEADRTSLQISTVLGTAVKEQREESAWSEGVAIWVAVIVVSGVGAPPPLFAALCCHLLLVCTCASSANPSLLLSTPAAHFVCMVERFRCV